MTARGSLPNAKALPNGVLGSTRMMRGVCAAAAVLSAAAATGRSFKTRMLTSLFRWVSEGSVTLGPERVYRTAIARATAPPSFLS
jgi:hypothetical protein